MIIVYNIHLLDLSFNALNESFFLYVHLIKRHLSVLK